MKISQALRLQLTCFVVKLKGGQFKDVAQLAEALEHLSNSAWAEAFEFTPPLIRID